MARKKSTEDMHSKYFCSNKEAKDAGYQTYTDLYVN